jgi:hypothetical protein
MEDTSYLFTEYGRRKEFEGYEMEMKDNESFNFKDDIYDQIEEAVKLTTDWEFGKRTIEYRDKLQEIFDGVIETVNNLNSAKRAEKFTTDLFTILGDILNPRKAV